MRDPIWEGVYESFDGLKNESSAFEDNVWINNSMERITKLKQAALREKTIPDVLRYAETILPVVASMVCRERGNLRILDFGGGIGFSYYQVRRSITNSDSIEFHIIDTPAVCEAGRDFFKDEQNLFFYSKLPDNNERFSIIHFGSSLQYVEKWRDLLGRILLHRPLYVIFSDLPAGDIPTYASLQYYHGSKIPMWFFNVNEIIGCMADHGCDLIFKGTYQSNILGIAQPYPQNNFKREYRLGASCILMFQHGTSE